MSAGTESEKARLTVTAAGFAADGEASALGAGKPPDRRLVTLIGQVDAVLRNPPLANQVSDAIAGLDDSFFKAVVAVAPQDIAAWNQRFAAVMEQAAVDPRFSTADHLYTLYAQLTAGQGARSAA